MRGLAPLSMTAANYGWTLSASCCWIESREWKAGRAVGTTCACASAYGCRDAPSPVAFCALTCLCLVLEILAGFAQDFFARNVFCF